MKKFILMAAGIAAISAALYLVACEQSAPVNPDQSNPTTERRRQNIGPVQYYSPDQTTPPSWYTPCQSIPVVDTITSDIVPMTSNDMITVYVGTFDAYGADSVQFAINVNGYPVVIWAEKWMNTNALFLRAKASDPYLSPGEKTLQEFCQAIGLNIRRANVTVSATAYGRNGTASATLSTSFALNF